MTTAIANASRTCRAWCTNHGNDGDVCLDTGTGIDLDFSAGRRSVDTAKFADVSLTHCDDEGTTLWLGIAGLGSAHFEVEHAKQLAEAILAKCRQAEAAQIPGPRTAPDGDLS